MAERTIAEFAITSFTDTSVGEPKNTMAIAVQTSQASVDSSASMSQVTLNSDQSNILAVTSDKSVTLEVDSQKSTAIGVDD